MSRPELADHSPGVVYLFRRTAETSAEPGDPPGMRSDGTQDVVAPGRKPDPRSADPWRHDWASEAGPPATVQGQHDTGLLRLRLDGDGTVGEYELDVQQALHLAQRLRDAATAMRVFLSARDVGPGQVSG